MRRHRVIFSAFLIAAWLGHDASVWAQSRTISDAECQSLRQRLSDHARLSEGVRRSLGTQAAAAPAAPVAPAPSPAPAAGRAEAIRARLEQIPKDRQVLEDQRLAAMVRFEFNRASQIQGQIQNLDNEKSNLVNELAALPTAVATPAAPAPQPPSPETSRIRCQDMPAAVDNALKIRRRELGAREEQTGTIPLATITGQTPDQIAQDLARQFPAGAAAQTQVGLLDADGNGKIDGFVDVPAPGIYRLVRQRADGTVSVDVFAAPGSGATPAYSELTRRLDETAARQTGDKVVDMLARRPAGPVRTLIETGDFAEAYKQFETGNFADAARISAAAARTVEFENFRGERVRMIEIISPVTGGFALRRAVGLAQPNDRELWEETNIAVRPASYLRTDVEVTKSRETRTAAGTPVGARSTSAPVRFSLER